MPGDPVVIYQTRIWGKRSVGSDNPEELNDGRIRLIEILRKELGHVFVGGLVPNDVALKYYPHLVVRNSYGRREYIQLAKPALIGIYTRGIHHSTAFKLGEYLSSSKCIVAEPLRNSLPEPFVAGVHYVPFVTPEECVDACVRLLEDRTAACAMRHENWKYYQDAVRPWTQMKKRIEEAFEGPAGGYADARLHVVSARPRSGR
jgi:hypothetical protein